MAHVTTAVTIASVVEADALQIAADIHQAGVRTNGTILGNEGTDPCITSAKCLIT